MPLESEATSKLRGILVNIHGHVLMVGTGGSFVAAEFAAKLVTQYHDDVYAEACKPRDVMINGINKVSAVFLFSYSGKTKDIHIVYDFCKQKCVPVFIITKYTSSSDEKLYDTNEIISYNASKSTTKERGFISMAGTMIPMCIFGELYYTSEIEGETLQIVFSKVL